MDTRLNVNQPIRPLKNNNNVQKKADQNDKQKKSFKKIFSQQLDKKDKLSFSKHAEKRVKSRPIPFTQAEMKKLQTGADKARAKGARDSLIMVNNTAYIVSVENNKVITAVDEGSMNENVFTNIDSAVFMK